MSAQIGSRPLSDAERAALAFCLPCKRLRALLGSLARFFVGALALYLALAVLAGLLEVIARNAGFVTQASSDRWGPILVIAIGLYGLMLGVPSVYAVRRYRRLMHAYRLRARDLHEGMVQTIAFVMPRCAVAADDKQLSLLFAIDGGSTLALEGMRILREPGLFTVDDSVREARAHDLAIAGKAAAPDTAQDEDEDNDPDFPDRPDDAIPLPNTDFIVHRLPHSGRVLRIELRGEPSEHYPVYPLAALRLPEIEQFSASDECMSLIAQRPLTALLTASPLAEPGRI